MSWPPPKIGLMTYAGAMSKSNPPVNPVAGQLRTDTLTGEIYFYDGSQWLLISAGVEKLTEEMILKDECDELVAGMAIGDAVYALRMMRRLLDEPENELIQREFQNLKIALKMTKE